MRGVRKARRLRSSVLTSDIWVLRLLHNLPHDRPEARNKPHREQERQPDLLPRTHLHLEQNVDRNCKEHKVHRAMDCAEGYNNVVRIVDALLLIKIPSAQDGQVEIGQGGPTLEDVDEDGGDAENDTEGEEDVVKDHPIT